LALLGAVLANRNASARIGPIGDKHACQQAVDRTGYVVVECTVVADNHYLGIRVGICSTSSAPTFNERLFFVVPLFYSHFMTMGNTTTLATLPLPVLFSILKVSWYRCPIQLSTSADIAFVNVYHLPCSAS
jgi:hypothetical protein